MIEVRNLTKRYRDLVAIDQISFDVAKGEILGFLGRNGAGKTTTMRILTGFLPASSGTAKVAGFDVFEQPLEVKRRVGYLPEQPPLYQDMTVYAYLKFVAQLKGVPRSKLKSEMERVANLTSVGAVMDRVIVNLSKGYRQRVGLAQALLNDPEILILDEPTVGLDPIQVREFRDLIRSLAGKHTVILSTHILSEITATCQRVLIIRQGKVVACDDLAGLSKKYQEPNRELSLEEIFVKLAEN
ncbi:MAG: ABC transporter ATP-binding protein [Deltaproteobacteria bacterium]